jgi:hypothetical protein
MRTLLLLALVACAGPSQQKLADTPTATTKRPSPVAPPASDNDKDRYQMDRQLEDARDAQQAHREASEPAPPPGAPVKPSTPAPPVKRGPVEQAPPPPTTK